MIIEKRVDITSFLNEYMAYIKVYYSQEVDPKSVCAELKKQYCIPDSISFKEKQQIKDQLLINLSQLDGKFVDYICTGHFNSAIFQMQLEKEINCAPLEKAIAILSHLRNCTSCEYRFANTKDTKEKLFQIAIELFFIDEREYTDVTNQDLIEMIKAARYLQTHGFTFSIKNGQVELSDVTDQQIFHTLEKLILQSGANNVLRRLFNLEFYPILNFKHMRYMIFRKKSMIGDSIKLMIPYNLILQLCVKNISGKHPIIPKDSNENYEQIKKLSISYTVCLGLQNNNIWEDIYLPHEDIPEYLVRNAIFDTFFYIQQWNPDYCMELTQNAFSMLFNQFSGKKYKLHDYMKVMQTILRFQKPLTCIGYDEIKRKTNLVDNSLLAIMENIAHKSSGININFNSILGKTNFYDKPLIEVSPQKYLLISPIICGFSFYQVLYRLCQSNDPQKKFDRLQGEEVEKFVLKCIKRKKFPYANGHYRYDFALNAENRECDLILEGSKRIVFVEIKKRPLPDNFQEIDFFDLTTCLAEGIVTAQLQAFRHKIQLKRKGVIDLYKDAARKHKEKTICLNNRVVNCVSLVSQEYGFLSYSMFGQKLLQVLTIGDFKSDDPDNMKRLTKINARAAQAQALYEMYANGRQLRLNEIYHDFTFRTCQQLMYAIDNSSTIEELIDNLINDTYVLNGTSDYYCQLFAHIDMKKKV